MKQNTTDDDKKDKSPPTFTPKESPLTIKKEVKDDTKEPSPGAKRESPKGQISAKEVKATTPPIVTNQSLIDEAKEASPTTKETSPTLKEESPKEQISANEVKVTSPPILTNRILKDETKEASPTLKEESPKEQISANEEKVTSPPNVANQSLKDEAKETKTPTLKQRMVLYKKLMTNWQWVPTSLKKLEDSEKVLLSHLKGSFKTYYVDLNAEQKKSEDSADPKQSSNESKEAAVEERKIWTIKMESPNSNKTPILLIHGFNLAFGIWIMNLDSLAEHRKVYAIDMLGFGRSSRPKFKPKEKPEDDLVDTIEQWREKVGLKKFMLLGHSFGGYICASYALKYAANLEPGPLILVEPWGFFNKRDLMDKINILSKGVVKFFVHANINPLAHLRAIGMAGKTYLKITDNISKNFEPVLGKDSKQILDYLYHCNALKASGELILKQLITDELTAKRPIINRIKEFSPNLHLVFIYAENSWLYKESENNLRNLFINNELDYVIIPKAAHDIPFDKPNEFNAFINNLA